MPTKRGTSRPGWWVAAVRLLILADAFALALVLFDAPHFKVSRVTLLGLDRTPAADVMQLAHVEGQNVLTLNPQRVARSLGSVPTVARARVARQLPNHVVIAIEERQPRAIWETRGARYLVDGEGVVIGSAADEDLITLVEPGGRAMGPGDRVDAGAVGLMEKLAVTLPRDLGLQPVGYQYAGAGGLVILTADGWKLAFGTSDDFEYKMATLRSMLDLAKQGKGRIDLIDVRSRHRPYYHLAADKP